MEPDCIRKKYTGQFCEIHPLNGGLKVTIGRVMGTFCVGQIEV